MIEKTIKFKPAYDKRNSDPKKNYGIHGVEMRWLLKGELGTIQFVVFTSWHLPNVRKELNKEIPGLKKVKLNIKYQEKDITKSVEIKGYEPNDNIWIEQATNYPMYHLMFSPMAADLGYHSPKPMYKGHAPTKGKCQFLKGQCYYDGSGLQAEQVFELLIEKGDEAVWERLEEEYIKRFGELK